jgi:hypothetical protein
MTPAEAMKRRSAIAFGWMEWYVVEILLATMALEIFVGRELCDCGSLVTESALTFARQSMRSDVFTSCLDVLKIRSRSK